MSCPLSNILPASLITHTASHWGQQSMARVSYIVHVLLWSSANLLSNLWKSCLSFTLIFLLVWRPPWILNPRSVSYPLAVWPLQVKKIRKSNHKPSVLCVDESCPRLHPSQSGGTWLETPHQRGRAWILKWGKSQPENQQDIQESCKLPIMQEGIPRKYWCILKRQQ